MEELEVESASDSSNKLTVTYLLWVTTGVAVAIAAARAIQQLRFQADYLYYSPDERANMYAFEGLISLVYGVCITSFIFACRSGSLWNSPGKTLALLFAIMGAVDSLFEFVAAVIMYQRMEAPLPNTVLDHRPFIAGIWYRYLSSSIGYILGVPITAVIIYKTRKQRFGWRMVWIGFFLSALIMLGAEHLRFKDYVTDWITDRQFEIATGIPTILIANALLFSLLRRDRLDWWTLVIAPLIIITWVAVILGRSIWM